MNIDIGIRHIDIDLKPGVYAPDFESGSGKTYLYRLIKTAEDVGYNVKAFTYNSDTNPDIIVDKLKSKEWDYVIFDRYILYECDKISNAITDLKCPVLIDVKSYMGVPMLGCKDCVIELNRDGIKVYVDDF